MAKTTVIEEPPALKTEKECPKCHSTMFQGPHLRGRIVDGKFMPSEELFSCLGCHAVLSVADMQDRVTLAATL